MTIGITGSQGWSTRIAARGRALARAVAAVLALSGGGLFAASWPSAAAANPTTAAGAPRVPVPGAVFNESHRNMARQFYGQEHARKCPPGLVREGTACVPLPGATKKYAVGTRLPGDLILHPVPQPLLAHLPEMPRGYRYVRVGEDLVLISPGTPVVIDIIAAVTR